MSPSHREGGAAGVCPGVPCRSDKIWGYQRDYGRNTTAKGDSLGCSEECPLAGGLNMEETSRLRGKKVLVVDDEPDVLDTIEALLPECEVSKATTFAAAKGLLETRPFHIAILDIMGVEGFDLLKIANRHHVIAVMLTAHALSPRNLVKSFKEGAASYLPKEEMSRIPIFLNDILEAKERGENLWWRWLQRLDAYFAERFGPGWKDTEKDFWDKFPFYE